MEISSVQKIRNHQEMILLNMKRWIFVSKLTIRDMCTGENIPCVLQECYIKKNVLGLYCLEVQIQICR